MRVWLRLLLVVALVAYARWFVPLLAPYAGSADSSGYIWSAQLFARGQLAEPLRRPTGAPPSLPADAFAPLGTLVRSNRTELVPSYPTGLPLLLALGLIAAPLDTGLAAVVLVAALTTLWLTYRLGRAAGLDRLWSVVPAALLGCSPLFVFSGQQVMSDVPSTSLALGVVLLAWRARRRPSSAIWAGAVLGLATLVRPTNIVFAAPLVAAVGLSFPLLWRVAIGGIPFAIFLLVYQLTLFGSPFSTGYGDVRSAFATSSLAPTLRHYATWLPSLFSWLIVGAPAGWWLWRGPHRTWQGISAAWVAGVFALYAAYFHTAETWWYLRFILPAMPPMLVATARAGQRALELALPRAPARTVVACSAVAALLVAWLVPRALLRHPLVEVYRATRVNEGEYRSALRWFAIHHRVERPVLMVQLGGAARVYTPELLTVRFDRLSTEHWQALRAWQQRSGTTVDAALLPFEEPEFLAAAAEGRLACRWELRDAYHAVHFWECAP
ncbi:MAG: hypothetical protein AB7I50_01090 [Vicinamibacterales bacterium]